MNTYRLCSNRIEIINNDRIFLIIHFTENSGKVYYRYKIDTISGIKHPGISLGVDTNGIGYFLHNHYLNGKAVIVTEQEFAQSKPLYPYMNKSSNDVQRVIETALYEAAKGQQYHPITYNCQTYVNIVVHNKRESEDVNKWAGITLGAAALIGLGLILGGKNRKRSYSIVSRN
jgi:hypothetical protein